MDMIYHYKKELLHDLLPNLAKIDPQENPAGLYYIFTNVILLTSPDG